MENRTFYNEILTDHNLHPLHKEKLPDANLVLEGVNPSCGDDIILQLKVEDGQVVDGAFEGSGCAISQASADIMLDLIIGKSEEEARHLADLFLRARQARTRSKNSRKPVPWSMFPICRRVSNARCWDGIRWKRCWIRRTRNKREDKKKRELFFWECQAGRTISALMIYIPEIVWKRKVRSVGENIYKNRLAKTKRV